MNIAFLVEGSTEFKLYPMWLSHFSVTPLSECITGYSDVVNNQFTIFNVEGIGKMKREIPVAIRAINANPVFDYFVIIVDADDNNTTNSLSIIQNIVNDPSTPSLTPSCTLKVIVQQVCIESWFIGHTDHYLTAKSSTDKNVLSFVNEYDAENNDPEMMPNNRFPKVHSIGTYHAAYLKHMLKGVNRTWRYGKSTAHLLIDIPYIQRLEQCVIEKPTHLQTFSDMMIFLKSL